MCTNAPCQTLLSKKATSDGRKRVIWHRPDCMRWSCKECKPKLVAAWLSAISDALDKHKGPIGRMHIVKDFHPERKRLYRKYGMFDYVWIGEFGRTTFMTIVPEGATVVTKEQVLKEIAGFLRYVKDGGKFHPIGTSRPWNRHSHKASEYEVITEGTKEAQFNMVAEQHALQPQKRCINGKVISTVTCPLSQLEAFLATMKRKQPAATFSSEYLKTVDNDLPFTTEQRYWSGSAWRASEDFSAYGAYA